MYGRRTFIGLANFNYYEGLYNKTKSIRGRKYDCRPIGDRRRTHETIEKVSDDAYACQLYSTKCVTYHRDGSVDLFIDCYATPSTAEFIHTHSPFICTKRHNQLWIIAREDGGESKWYPILKYKVLKMVLDADGCWTPAEPLVVQQKKVDRKKANEARAPLKKFLQFGKAMLTMSDGWVRHDTKAEFADIESHHYKIRYNFRDMPEELRLSYNWYGEPDYNREAMYKFLSECDEQHYFAAYLYLLNTGHKAEDKRLAQQYENEGGWVAKAYDYKFSFAHFKSLVYKLADKVNDIHKLVEVEAGAGAMTNIA